MYKMRLESQNSANYNIFDRKELIVGSVSRNTLNRPEKRWCVQLMGELAYFPSLSAATVYVINK